jgi:predicted alpha-1,2-mannosidase
MSTNVTEGRYRGSRQRYPVQLGLGKLSGCLFLLVCAAADAAPAAAVTATPANHDLLRFIDPRIGVQGIGEGGTVIGPALPFGSIHPSPNTPEGWSTGYKAGQPIRGFSQTHVSGTGWGQYGNLLVSPRIGLATLPVEQDSPIADEIAEAHQYQVRLTRWGIHTQFTPTHHAAIYRFTYPVSEEAHLVFNAVHHIPGDIARQMFPWHDKPIPAELNIAEDGRSLSGESLYTGGFSGPYKLFYAVAFDRTPTAFGTWRNAQTLAGARQITSTPGVKEQLGAWLRFDTTNDATVQMKVAVSFHSVERARALLADEIPAFDYNAVRDAAAKAWRDALSAFTVQGGTDSERTQFYTAAYHAQLMPRNRSGDFKRYDAQTPMWDDHYAIWDTWRTLFPLLALIRPDVVAGSVNSFIERQRVDGAVSDTFIAGVNSWREQGGNGVDMVIADAHAKQVPGIDWSAAYAVMKHNADKRRTGPNFDDPKKGSGPYRSTGWIPAGIMSTSMSLEYSYNDFVASQVAHALRQRSDAKTYADRSRQWVNLWNPETESDGFKGFIMARNADLTWVDFDTKKYSGSWKPHFYESNAWTYSYFAPHQVARLVSLMGGKARFIERLEHALEKNYIDIFNEPSFLVPQLFHYVGRPDLSAKWLQRITGERFTLKGYPGDDDSGAMSSYYLFAKMGLFPNAGQDIYFLNGSAFDRIALRRPGHAPIVITRSGSGIYVASVTLDGKPVTRSWIRHAELQRATRLTFKMSNTPTAWARAALQPPSLP